MCDFFACKFSCLYFFVVLLACVLINVCIKIVRQSVSVSAYVSPLDVRGCTCL